MFKSSFNDRNRLIAGLAILIVVALLILYSVIAFALRGKERPQLGYRVPIASLSYCDTEQNKLCITTFSQIVDGGLQVNFQTPSAFYPDFILKIGHDGEESTYECQRAEETSTVVVCTGASQVPGQMLEFTVISKKWGTILAKGRFAIIGIALFTPAFEATPTVTATVTLTGAPTLLATASPNPSYPNPSYP